MTNPRIKELEQKINQARKEYYNGSSSISDKVYDAWVDELYSLDPKNLAVIGIGSEPVSDWDKYTHKIPMGSLNKAQTKEEYLEWHNKYIGKDDQPFLTLKLDGLSISLIYENGVLVKAVTRGSGTTGENIFTNAAKMKGVPLRLPNKLTATIRGEIVLTKKDHQKYFADYSNARNAASGISRRYDGEGCDKLTVMSYQLFTEDFEVLTQTQQFSELAKLKFITPTYYLLSTAQEVIDLKEKYQTELRDQYQVDLDGLVIHNNDIIKQNEFGSLNDRPYASIAFKFDSVAKEGTIADIIVQVGNSGRITPIAVFNPKVNLMGAEVEKASLHNFANISQLGIGVGAKVLVCRSNDVIPFVEEVIEPPAQVFLAPTHCPACNTLLVNQGQYVQCPNTATCPAQVIGRIKNWISELDIKEWGDTLIERLVQANKVTTIVDLYKLTVDDLANIERMGKKSAKKCHQLLWEKTEVPLDIFLGALSIPMIGGSTIRLIMKAGCDTLEKFGQLDAQHFEMVQGVGSVKAKSLADGLKNNQDLIINLLTYIKIKQPIIGALTGKKIAITGSTKNKRSDLEQYILQHGGEYAGTVNKTCTHLVIADVNSTSSKAVSARKLGIKLINEDELLNLSL